MGSIENFISSQEMSRYIGSYTKGGQSTSGVSYSLISGQSTNTQKPKSSYQFCGSMSGQIIKREGFHYIHFSQTIMYSKWPKNRYIYKELRFQSLVGSSRISTGISSRVSTGIRTRSSIGACSIISLPRCCFSRNQNQNQNLNKQNKTLCTFFSHFYVLRNYILTNRQILNIVN